MKIRNKTRLTKLGKSIDQRPLRRSAIDAALDHFRDTGELPEQPRLADAVTKKALDPNCGAPEEADPFLKYMRQIRAGLQDAGVNNRDEGRDGPPSQALRCLYSEAVWAPEPVREFARKALMWHRDCGDDVASPEFLVDRDMPAFGTVGFMLLGFPELIVLPPYEDQARRLFARYGELMKRKGPCDEKWEARFIDLSVRFYEHGKLPADPLERDIILGSTEIDALFEHRRGGNVKELMAALDAAALASGEEREAAIENVVAVIRRTDVEIVGRIS